MSLVNFTMDLWKTVAVVVAALLVVVVAAQLLYVVALTLFDYGQIPEGIWGVLKDVPEAEGPRVAVEVSDAQADDVKDRLHKHDATAVDDAVTRHDGQ